MQYGIGDDLICKGVIRQGAGKRLCNAQEGDVQYAKSNYGGWKGVMM